MGSSCLQGAPEEGMAEKWNAKVLTPTFDKMFKGGCHLHEFPNLLPGTNFWIRH